MKYAILSAAVLLTACAAPVPGEQINKFSETPDRDGKRTVLSRDDSQKMLQDAQAMGNALGGGGRQ